MSDSKNTACSPVQSIPCASNGSGFGALGIKAYAGVGLAQRGVGSFGHGTMTEVSPRRASGRRDVFVRPTTNAFTVFASVRKSEGRPCGAIAQCGFFFAGVDGVLGRVAGVSIPGVGGLAMQHRPGEHPGFGGFIAIPLAASRHVVGEVGLHVQHPCLGPVAAVMGATVGCFVGFLEERIGPVRRAFARALPLREERR